MAPLIRDRHRLERSTQVGFTRLAHVQAPISGKPEIGVCSAPLRAALRPGHESATQHSCATAGRAKNQPAGVGNDRRPRSIVQGLLFTMENATRACERRKRPSAHLFPARRFFGGGLYTVASISRANRAARAPRLSSINHYIINILNTIRKRLNSDRSNCVFGFIWRKMP